MNTNNSGLLNDTGGITLDAHNSGSDPRGNTPQTTNVWGNPPESPSERIVNSTYTLSSDNPSKAGSGSALMSQLTRSQWADYVLRFQPYDKKMIDMASGANDSKYEARAQEGIASSFATSKAINNRNSERLGLSSVDGEAGVASRMTANNQALANVSIRNNTRLHVADRNISMLSGSATTGLKSITTGGKQ